MKVYIRSAVSISAQNTFGNAPFLKDIIEYTSPRLKAIEPDYKSYIDARLIRRMSRIIRMGVTAAKESLNEAGVSMPDAIVTGTAYGCLEDTGIFLSRMIEQEEEALSPTAFIQSTHNTVGAQIALMLQCHQYNNTFVHKGFSFESALQDAIMLLQEQEATNVLTGAADELTDASYAILNRFDLYKSGPVSNLNLYDSASPGTIAGEGTAFFVLSGQPGSHDLAMLTGMQTFYSPSGPAEISKRITTFLAGNDLNAEDIDLVITGKNGDAVTDELIDQWYNPLFKPEQQINYKHLSGEYPTASSFALWLAARIIKTQTIPLAINAATPTQSIKTVLIINQYQNKYYSMMLLSAI